MSKYRDDQEAARHRIDSLEERLGEQRAELAARDEALAERDREIARLAGELRNAGTARMVIGRRRPPAARFVVAGALSAVVAAGISGFFSVHRSVEPATVTFADLPSPRMPLAAPRFDFDPTTDVQARGAEAESGSVDLAEERTRRMELLGRLAKSNASIDDIRTLETTCARLHDDACRDRAAAMLKGIEFRNRD